MKSYLKKILVLAMVIAPATLLAQNNTYRINGHVAGLPAAAKAYTEWYDILSRTSHLDSATIKNGNFTFAGTIDEPHPLRIYTDKKGMGFNWQTAGYIDLYAEAGDISVMSPDSIQNAKIIGGPVNADNIKLNLALKVQTDKIKRLDTLLKSAPAEKRNSRKFIDSLVNVANAVRLGEQPIYLAFIKANPSSMMSLSAVMYLGDDTPDVNVIEPAFNLLSAEVRASKKGMYYAFKINQMKKTSVGAIAPDFTLPDSLGKAVSLHDFKGKYVFVDFWASWCVPCRRENPNVLKAYNTYRSKNFTVVGISLDNTGAKNAWLKAIHDDQLTWTQLSGLNGFDSNAAQLYGISTIPQNFLVGPDGRIIALNLRGDALTNKLQQVLTR